jgi:hypothetical protein
MEKKEMIVKISGAIIGLLVLVAGVYYLIKEKNDTDSKKIYSIISIIGAVLLIISTVLLIKG